MIRVPWSTLIVELLVTVVVPLGLTGHVFAPRHRIRIAISSGYWPFAWPSPERVRLELYLLSRLVWQGPSQ